MRGEAAPCCCGSVPIGMLQRNLRRPDVVVVELTLLDEHKAVPHIEPVRSALTQGANEGV